MSKCRLQKLMSESGICSRRKAEDLLIQKRILLNGKIAKVGDKADLTIDEVIFDGKRIKPFKAKYIVILLNKPKGFLSSCSDPYRRKTVIDLIPKEIRKGLHPVGRLDYLSRGALLLTNNGELTLKLTHPRYLHKKTYNVLVEGVPSLKTLDTWRKGLILEGRRTIPASIKLLYSKSNSSMLNIILKEGRNRQIRKTAEKLGHKVIDLQRIGIEHINLNDLEEGKWRQLEEDEWSSILIKCKPEGER